MVVQTPAPADLRDLGSSLDFLARCYLLTNSFNAGYFYDFEKLLSGMQMMHDVLKVVRNKQSRKKGSRGYFSWAVQYNAGETECNHL